MNYLFKLKNLLSKSERLIFVYISLLVPTFSSAFSYGNPKEIEFGSTNFQLEYNNQGYLEAIDKYYNNVLVDVERISYSYPNQIKIDFLKPDPEILDNPYNTLKNIGNARLYELHPAQSDFTTIIFKDGVKFMTEKINKKGLQVDNNTTLDIKFKWSKKGITSIENYRDNTKCEIKYSDLPYLVVKESHWDWLSFVISRTLYPTFGNFIFTYNTLQPFKYVPETIEITRNGRKEVYMLEYNILTFPNFRLGIKTIQNGKMVKRDYVHINF